MNPTEKFLEVLQQTQFAGEPDQELIDATNQFADNKEPGTPEGLLNAIDTLPINGAGWLAILFGSGVEGGSDPMSTAPALWKTFCRRMEEFPPTPTNDDDDLPDLSDEQFKIADGFQFLCQGLVAHLARLPEFVSELSADSDLCDRIDFLQNYSHGFAWIGELLRRSSGTLIVLHTESRRALRVKYENISNCFHLFTLLQAAIGDSLPGGRTTDPEIAATAKGSTYVEGSDSAWWHYGNPLSTEPNMVASIFGEAPVNTIPTIDDQQVVILWPPVLKGRSWDTGFFGPPIAASQPVVTLEAELEIAEAEAWFQRVGIQAAS